MRIKLNGPQRWAWRRWLPGQTVVKPWGRGVGKSQLDRWFIWSLIAQLDGVHRSEAPEPYRRQCPRLLRGVRVNVLCDTLAHFKEMHRAVIESELTSSGPWGFLGARIDRSTMGITFPGGSEIRVFPALEHSAKKGLGARCDVVWVEETDDVPISTYNYVTLPWFSEPWSLKMRTASGTPRMGRNGLLYLLHRRGLDPEVPATHSLHATYRDAPGNVDESVVEEARQIMTPETFAREWESDFDASEGLVYANFDELFHVRPTPEKAMWSRVVVGVDWGFVDPHVFLVCGVAGHGLDSQMVVLEEHYESGRTLEHWQKIAKGIVNRFGRVTFLCDPSRPDSILTLQRHTGCRAIGAKNKIVDGLSAVAEKLARRGSDRSYARLYIDPSCHNLIREFGLYRRKRDPRSRDTFLEEPEDKHNHALDALRYAVIESMGGPDRGRSEAGPRR